MLVRIPQTKRYVEYGMGSQFATLLQLYPLWKENKEMIFKINKLLDFFKIPYQFYVETEYFQGTEYTKTHFLHRSDDDKRVY